MRVTASGSLATVHCSSRREWLVATGTLMSDYLPTTNMAQDVWQLLA